MVSDDTSPKDTLPNGYQFHWYEFLDVLGRGSFGVTYLANDKNLNKTVAIKEYLPSDFAVRDIGTNNVRAKNKPSQEIFEWGLKRFRDEAQTLAKFSHPNIVRVLAVFDSNNTAYMAMEYEAGKGLDELLRQKKSFDEKTLIKIFLPILDGLRHVHEAGFIHRDIKPSNIMVRNCGTPVLIDFGSARKTLQDQTSALTSLITQGYAPFEQYDQENNLQGPWTDIYSLAATIYRLIAGRNPVDSMTRGIAIANNNEDPYLPLAGKEYVGYSSVFLSVVDDALGFKTLDRPQTAEVWIKQLTATQENKGAISEEIVLGGMDSPPSSKKVEIVKSVGKKQSFRRVWLSVLGLLSGAYLMNSYFQDVEVSGSSLDSETTNGNAALVLEKKKNNVQLINGLLKKAKFESESIEFTITDNSKNNAVVSEGSIALYVAAIEKTIAYYRQVLSVEPNNPDAKTGVVFVASKVTDALDSLLSRNRFKELELMMVGLSVISEITSITVLFSDKISNKKLMISKAVREEADQLALERLAAEKKAQKRRREQALSEKKKKERLARIAEEKIRWLEANSKVKQMVQIIKKAVEGEDVKTLQLLSGGDYPLEVFFESLFSAYQDIELVVHVEALNKDITMAPFTLEFKSLNNKQALPVIASEKWRVISGMVVKNQTDNWGIKWAPFL